MTNRLKRMLTSSRALESRVASVVETAARAVTRPGEAPPLEVIDRAAEEIALQIVPAGRGRYVFPYNSVTIMFAAPTAESRARLDAICAGPPSLSERVLQRLASAGCEAAV